MTSIDTLESPQDDGLLCDDAGAWVEDKHNLVFLYDSLFSTGMKNKWEARVYIDLYSGPGIVRLRDTGKLLWGSPLLALQVKDPFDKYIFCENKPEYLDALRTRAQRISPKANISFIAGDCNEVVEAICAQIPMYKKDYRVLSFCFVDPYDLSIRFSTIRRISEGFVDFLVLLALQMDASRNESNYMNPNNRKLDNFLGQSDWRRRRSERTGSINFARFVAEEYAKGMEGLEYRPVPFDKMKQIRSDVKNLPLYRLALFSRSSLADQYWDQVLKYSTSQHKFWG
jgi:three-Cys-motif partner protein